MKVDLYKKTEATLDIQAAGLLTEAEAKKLPGRIIENRGGFWLKEEYEGGSSMIVTNDGLVCKETLPDYTRAEVIPVLTVSGLDKETQKDFNSTVVINGVEFTPIGNDRLFCKESLGDYLRKDVADVVRTWVNDNFVAQREEER